MQFNIYVFAIPQLNVSYSNTTFSPAPHIMIKETDFRQPLFRIGIVSIKIELLFWAYCGII